MSYIALLSEKRNSNIPGQRSFCHHSSVKTTAKYIQRYNNTYATYHALINLKGGLIQTPPKSHFMQSTHKMWPKCIFKHLCIATYNNVLINVVY